MTLMLRNMRQQIILYLRESIDFVSNAFNKAILNSDVKTAENICKIEYWHIVK